VQSKPPALLPTPATHTLPRHTACIPRNRMYRRSSTSNSNTVI